MNRFTLGNEHAAGWLILDSLAMSAHYYGDTEAEAQAYVEYRNLIDTIRTQQFRAEARAKVEFLAALGRLRDDA